MKIQDLVFFATIFVLLWSKCPKLFVFAGLASLVIAIPLFGFWVFFTAERLVWYAAGFFFIFILFSLRDPHKVQ